MDENDLNNTITVLQNLRISLINDYLLQQVNKVYNDVKNENMSTGDVEEILDIMEEIQVLEVIIGRVKNELCI